MNRIFDSWKTRRLQYDKCKTKLDERVLKLETSERRKRMLENLIDRVNNFPTNVDRQKPASIQPRKRRITFGDTF